MSLIYKQPPKKVSNSSGIPSKNTNEYVAQGWNKIPDLAKLRQVIGQETGGEPISVSYVKIDDITWAKVGVAEGATAFSDGYVGSHYFSYNKSVWVIEKTPSSKVTSRLNKN